MFCNISENIKIYYFKTKKKYVVKRLKRVCNIPWKIVEIFIDFDETKQMGNVRNWQTKV